MEFQARLKAVIAEERILTEEPMKRHTTFRVGGPAQYFVLVNDSAELQAVVRLCREEALPYVVVGNGSNLLVSDDGFRGVVIHLSGSFGNLTVREQAELGMAEVEVGAAYLLTRFSLEMAKKGFRGMEFAAGIPGTLGGAVVMNAGAYGGEIKDFITKAEVLEETGELKIYTKEELQLSYRHSIVQERALIVTRAWFEFGVGSRLQMLSLIDSYSKQRREKQPLEFPSAGSTFKRPKDGYAGKLIMEAGLAGKSIGGAEVSEKHCGFVINTGEATARDIYELMQLVIRTVEERSGIRLEPEVKLLGTF